MNNIPKDCTECKKYKTCNKAHYLSMGCDYYNWYIENYIINKRREVKDDE